MSKKILCFGECLWDLFPSGKVAGGAPMNVAIQLNNLGFEVGFISRVGNDDLGTELRTWQASKGLSNHLVQVDETHSTGVVEVSLSDSGSPSYTIAEPVAWDFIAPTESLKEAVEQSDVFVFGSLVGRNDNKSAQTLVPLLELASLKVFDVNLRAPHYDLKSVCSLMEKANIVKMNDEELELVTDALISNLEIKNQMRFLSKHFSLDTLIVTFGDKGAKVLTGNQFYETQGVVVEVEDTVGCGDAFLAGYLSKFVQGVSPEKCLYFAAGMGAYLATQKGGTPSLNEKEIIQFLEGTS